MEGVIALFIPILALSIPLVAILSRSFRRPAPTSPQQEQEIRRLQDRVSLLEESLERVSSQLGMLQDSQRFLTKLLEDKHPD